MCHKFIFDNPREYVSVNKMPESMSDRNASGKISETMAVS